MTIINLNTIIRAPIRICFNLSRSIDVHLLTTTRSNEKAIEGRTSGLINKGEQVTWQATHFGVIQSMTVGIVGMSEPHYFFDKMIRGPFKSMEHSHTFRTHGNETIMVDIFQYEVPFGIVGKMLDRIILKSYMTRLLTERNKMIKEIAESEEWKKFMI